MKVLVTGASGFIGRNLLPRLSSSHELFPVVRDADAIAAQWGRPVVANLVEKLPETELPDEIDVVIHLAQSNAGFPAGAKDLFAVNTASTQNLLDYARKAGARRFVLASSGDVYGKAAGLLTESDQARPAGYYATTKYASELLVNSYSDCLAPCILRLFHPYGPGQRGRLIPKLAARIARREPVEVDKVGGPSVSPIYVDDVVDAFEKVLDSSGSGLFNVAGDRRLSMMELAREIGVVIGVEPLFWDRGGDPADMMGDNSLMRGVLGVSPKIGLGEGLLRTLTPELRYKSHD